MSGFKGTKGPWGYDVDENNHCIDLVLPNETVISYARDSRYTDKYVIERDEMNANMKLISKAPEMLEMLEKMVEIIDKIHPDIKPIALLALRMNSKELIKSATEL